MVHWFHRTVCPIIDMANTVADDVEGVHNPKQSRPRYRDEHHDRGEEHGDPHHDPLHAPSLRAQSRPFADLEPLQPWGLPSWPWPPGTSARRGFFGITHTMSLVGYARNLMPDRTLQQARPACRQGTETALAREPAPGGIGAVPRTFPPARRRVDRAQEPYQYHSAIAPAGVDPFPRTPQTTAHDML